jgi:hypothetical protein
MAVPARAMIREARAMATVSSPYRDKRRTKNTKERNLEIMSVSTIVLVILILFLIGALPTWPYSSNWGYYPSGGLGAIVLILLVLVLLGRL